MNSLRKRSTRLECEALEDRVTPATLTWLGAASGLWSNPGNWGTTDQTHTVPYDGADLVFPATAGNLTQIDDLPALSLSTITFLGGGYQISDNNGITLPGKTLLTPVISVESGGADSIGNVIIDVTGGPAALIAFSPAVSSHLSISQLIVNGRSDQISSFDIFPSSLASNPPLSIVSVGSMQLNGMIYIEVDNSALDLLPGCLLQLPPSGRLSLADNGHMLVENGAGFDDLGSTVIGFVSPGSTVTNSSSELDVAGWLTVGQELGPDPHQVDLNVDGGLLFVQSTGILYVRSTLMVGFDNVFIESGAVTEVGGELYTAGLIIVENAATIYIEHQTAFCVVAPGGQLYDIGLVEAVEGGQFYTYGLSQIIGTGTSGLYVYDGTIYVEPGGDLYAYGLVAAEPNTAFYDYGLFCLEPSGYLYVAGLFVVEPGALFFDYGPFVAPGGTYFNFGRQIGWGHL